MDPLAPLRALSPSVTEEPSLPEVVKARVSPQERGRRLAKALVQDREYLAKLKERLREGKAGASSMELMLWARAFGEVEKGASVTANVGVTVVKPW